MNYYVAVIVYLTGAIKRVILISIHSHGLNNPFIKKKKKKKKKKKN